MYEHLHKIQCTNYVQFCHILRFKYMYHLMSFNTVFMHSWKNERVCHTTGSSLTSTPCLTPSQLFRLLLPDQNTRSSQSPHLSLLKLASPAQPLSFSGSLRFPATHCLSHKAAFVLKLTSLSSNQQLSKFQLLLILIKPVPSLQLLFSNCRA